MEGFALVTGGSFMAVVQPDFYRHENLVRKSIQIPSTQHKELKALAVELESSLGDVVETIMDLMRQDNYEQLKAAIIQKRERDLFSLSHSLDEAYAYLGSIPETLEDARFFFNAGQEGMIVA
ncbi:MAG TPA: hypothetical protein VF844_23385 [Ktedonobacteraceae bacterium]|jgi:hypothetical protein